MIAQGFDSTDAERLGFRSTTSTSIMATAAAPVVAQADFLAGLIEVLVGGRLRRRIASEFDADGKEYWVRQIAVGHENDPEVGWVLDAGARLQDLRSDQQYVMNQEETT